jgi:hypothetical protein
MFQVHPNGGQVDHNEGSPWTNGYIVVPFNATLCENMKEQRAKSTDPTPVFRTRIYAARNAVVAYSPNRALRKRS